MRTDRIENKALLEELNKVTGQAAQYRRGAEELAAQLLASRVQRDALRKFADRIDTLVGIGKLMLEANFPVRGDFVLGALDDALEDVCRATGAVRTPMRRGMTAEELREASASFLAAFSDPSAQGDDVLEGAREREESLAEFSQELREEKPRQVRKHRDSDTLPEPMDEKTRAWAMQRALYSGGRSGD